MVPYEKNKKKTKKYSVSPDIYTINMIKICIYSVI